MEHQQRLFRLAPTDLYVSATHGPEGWLLRVGMRRQDEDWHSAEQRVFERLSTAELVDVLDVEVPRLLGFL